MVELNMTLARHNELRAHYHGKATGIHRELKDAGFDLTLDWSKGIEKETGNYIFMQAEPKKAPKKEPKKAQKTEGIGWSVRKDKDVPVTYREPVKHGKKVSKKGKK